MQVTETHALQPLIIPPTDEPSAYKLIVTEIPRPISGTIVPVKNKEINDLEVWTLDYGYMHCISTGIVLVCKWLDVCHTCTCTCKWLDVCHTCTCTCKWLDVCHTCTCTCTCTYILLYVQL